MVGKRHICRFDGGQATYMYVLMVDRRHTFTFWWWTGDIHVRFDVGQATYMYVLMLDRRHTCTFWWWTGDIHVLLMVDRRHTCKFWWWAGDIYVRFNGGQTTYMYVSMVAVQWWAGDIYVRFNGRQAIYMYVLMVGRRYICTFSWWAGDICTFLRWAGDGYQHLYGQATIHVPINRRQVYTSTSTWRITDWLDQHTRKRIHAIASTLVSTQRLHLCAYTASTPVCLHRVYTCVPTQRLHLCAYTASTPVCLHSV